MSLLRTTTATPRNIAAFRQMVLRYWEKQGRHGLPWRETCDPYKILVSEVMLQQTQVDRVIPFYTAFLKRFPTVEALAAAELSEVFPLWQGLGYNRRARFLRDMAREVVSRHGGTMPRTRAELVQLPGVGPYTAGAVAAFAYDSREVFIETNIRAVFIHHFFPGRDKVTDSELMSLIEEAARTVKSPREWYWALMDYGVHIKSLHKNPARRSRHHVKQSAFKGSVREVRGALLRTLSTSGMDAPAIIKKTGFSAIRVETALAGLYKDGMIRKKGTRWHIS